MVASVRRVQVVLSPVSVALTKICIVLSLVWRVSVGELGDWAEEHVVLGLLLGLIIFFLLLD